MDLETGAVVAVTVQPANRGNTKSLEETLDEVTMVFEDVLSDPAATAQLSDQLPAELVADKGYHSNAVLTGSNLGLLLRRQFDSGTPRRFWDPRSRQALLVGVLGHFWRLLRVL